MVTSEAANVFISYRREDTGAYAGWLHDRLRLTFGSSHVFKDLDDIRLGENFPQRIAQAIAACDVFLAVIGENWNPQLPGAAGRVEYRLDDPGDWVRVETEAALDLGVVVIPMLVGDTRMPSEDSLPPSMRRVRYINGITVGYQDFDVAYDRLLARIKSRSDGSTATSADRVEKSRVIRFASLEKLFREQIDEDDAHKWRREMDLLIDSLPPDESVINLALGSRRHASDSLIAKTLKTLDLTSGLIALTERSICHVVRPIVRTPVNRYLFVDDELWRVPYSEILQADKIGLVTDGLVLTLPGANVRFDDVTPRGRARELVAYIRDRLSR